MKKKPVQVAWIAALLFGFAAFFTGPALADTEGPSGEIASVTLLTPSADNYVQYHGRMFVLEADDTLTEYRWGGTSCGSKVLSESQVARLMDLSTAPYMRITPVWENGAGSTICLVGVIAFNAKFE